MTTHANCTNPKFVFSLMCPVSLGLPVMAKLARTLHSLLPGLPTKEPGADMNFIQEKFASVFAGYEVTTQPRPDGAVLLTLRDSEGTVTRRSISYAQLHTAEQLTWVISAIRRDLAGAASELPAINNLQSQNRFALPTYHSA